MAAERRWRLDVPAAFAGGVVGHGDDDGRRWLAGLPGLVDDLLDVWDLTPDGPVRHGFLGLVLPVRRAAEAEADAERFVVKVSRPSPEADNQVAALTAWRGRGMVLLHAADRGRGALLLERLADGRTLADVDPAEAFVVAAGLVRRLAVPADDTDLPALTEHVAAWPARWALESAALTHPLPDRLLTAAVDALRERVADPAPEPRLVDHDLHLGNVVAGTREPWLAIDPRGVVGDAEFTVAPMLWNDFRGVDDLRERFATFVDGAGLDRDRTAGWTLVRVVDHFLWSTAAGLTWDPAACRAIAAWLVNPGPGSARRQRFEPRTEVDDGVGDGAGGPAG